jgi:MFS family permease
VFGLLISLNGLVICLVELPLTSVTRRRSARRVMVTGCLIFGLGFALTGFVSAIWALVAVAVMWTLGEMLFFPMQAAHVANVSPPDMRGRYQGAWGMAWGMGAVLGPMAGTAVFAWHPRVLWVGCGVSAAIGAVLLVIATAPGHGPRAGE